MRALYEAYYRGLTQVAGDLAVAEEIVQAAFVAMRRAWPRAVPLVPHGTGAWQAAGATALLRPCCSGRPRPGRFLARYRFLADRRRIVARRCQGG